MSCDLFHDPQTPPNDGHCPPPHPDDCCFEERRRDITQYADISLPVDIDPSAAVGRIETEWLGEPIVVCRKEHCGNTCKITITQKVRVTIPITYCVVTCVGDPDVDCCIKHPCENEKCN